jgi:folate-binding protein YgfZ
VSGLDVVPAAGEIARATFAGAALDVAATVVAGSPGFRLDAGPERAAALWSALREAGARPIGLVARESLRVEAGAAAWGRDIDEQVYPQEARLERAFSLAKGCYTGQEVVAKIDTYGGLNKRLVALRVPHDDPVARGTRLHRLDEGEWRDLGVVTSWAYSFVLDTGLVLAFVKRRHQAAGTEFRLGDGPATATIVPLPVRAGAVPVTGEFE